jgi:hypothetical protein
MNGSKIKLFQLSQEAFTLGEITRIGFSIIPEHISKNLRAMGYEK